jgi:hypothetical protein
MENNSMIYNNSQTNQYVVDPSFKYEDQKNNGRIQHDRSQNGTPFFIQDLIPKNEKTNYFNATQHMMNPTLLSNTYFSKENIEIIQNAIRSEIYKKTQQKHIIDKQDYDQIKIIMRSVFLQYSLHKSTNIREQVEQLNQIVLNYCVPRVYSELMSYLKYKEDISTLPVPQENPIFLAPDKTLELKHFF